MDAFLSVLQQSGVALPGKTLLDPELFQDYSAKQFSGVLDTFMKGIKEWKKSSQSLVDTKRIMWSSSGPDEEDPTTEVGFFLPAPFDKQCCVNTETTLGTNVVELCTPVLHKSVVELQSSAEIKKILPQRTMVAYGRWNAYRIYELQELELAWTSITSHGFVIPERVGSLAYHELVFPTAHLMQLHDLLMLEYSETVATPLLEFMKHKGCAQKEWRAMFATAVKGFRQFSEEQKGVIREYLEWTFTAGMLMRGWKWKSDSFPIAYHDTTLSFLEELDLCYALERVRDLASAMKLPLRGWLNTLRTVEISLLDTELHLPKASAGTDSKKRKREEEEKPWEEDPEDPKDPEEEEDEKKRVAEHPLPEEKKQEVATPSAEMLETLISDKITSMMTKIVTTTSDDDAYLRPIPFVDTKTEGKHHPQIQVCFEGNMLQEELRDILQDTCYRVSSKCLCQSAAYYLQTLFGVSVPNLPLYGIEDLDCE